MCNLFNKMEASDHCIFRLLMPRRLLQNTVRDRGHGFSSYLVVFVNSVKIISLNLTLLEVKRGSRV